MNLDEFAIENMDGYKEVWRREGSSLTLTQALYFYCYGGAQRIEITDFEEYSWDTASFCVDGKEQRIVFLSKSDGVGEWVVFASN